MFRRNELNWETISLVETREAREFCNDCLFEDSYNGITLGYGFSTMNDSGDDPIEHNSIKILENFR